MEQLVSKIDALISKTVNTFVIFPPVKLAKRFRESVNTFDARWTVNLFEAGTIFLHLVLLQKKCYIR